MASSQKFIARNRAPRVQIEYDVELYGAEKKVQLPFVMGVMSDLAGKSEVPQPSVADRKFLEIDVDNFDDRMRAIKPRAAFTVPNTLTGEGNLAVDVTFESMDDFTPAAIAAKVEPLRELLEARTQLSNLMTYMDGKTGAEDLVARIIQDPALLKTLAAQPKRRTDEDALAALAAQAPAEAPAQGDKAGDAVGDVLAGIAPAPEAAPAGTGVDDVLAGIAPAPEAAPDGPGIDAVLSGIEAAPEAPAGPDAGDVLAGLEAPPEAADAPDVGAILAGVEAVPDAAPEGADVAAVLGAIPDAPADAEPDAGDVLASLEAVPETEENDAAADVLAGLAPPPDAPAEEGPEAALASLGPAPEAAPDTGAEDVLGGLAPPPEAAPEDAGDAVLADLAARPEADAPPEVDPDDVLAGLEAPPEAADAEDAGAPLAALAAASEDLPDDAAGTADLDAALADLADAAPTEVEADADLDALLSGLAEDGPDAADAPEAPDLAAMLPAQDAADPGGDAEAALASLPDAPPDEAVEAIDLDDLMADLSKDAPDAAAAEADGIDAVPGDDLDALLSDLEEDADAPDPAAEDDLDALLGDLDADDPDAAEDDLDALLADAPDEAAPAPAEETEPDDLDDLLGDPEDGAADAASEGEGSDDLDALLADLDGDAPGAAETEADDLDDLLGDLDADAAEGAADDLDALLGDLDDAPDGAAPAADDLDGLLGDPPADDDPPAAEAAAPEVEKPFGLLPLEPLDTAAMDRGTFRIAVFGDFSGRAAKGLMETGEALRRRRPIRLDVDDAEETIEGFATTLSLDLGGTRVEVPLNELDDLHPDELWDNVALFDELRGLRQRLASGAMAAGAAETLKAWGAAHGTKVRLPARSAATSVPADRKLSDFRRLIGDDRPAPPEATGGMDDLVARIVGPHVRADDAGAEAMRAALDEAASAAMRLILHHPDFQAVEAQWRSLDLLARRVETGVGLEIVLFDVSAEELAADIAADDDLSQSGFLKLLADNADPIAGAGAFSVVTLLHVFEETPPHAALLARLARIGAHVGAPVIAAMSPTFLETKLKDRHPLVTEAWETLRAMPEAAHLGLAAPRALLRLPYGKRSDPVSAFDFEEFTAQEGLSGMLWANPAVIVTILIAATRAKGGKDMRLGDVMTLDDMPFHWITDRHGDQISLPCTERNVTTETMPRATTRGIMPLLSPRGRNVVQLGSMRSVGGAMLAGPWPDAAAAPPPPDEPAPAPAPEGDGDSDDMDALTSDADEMSFDMDEDAGGDGSGDLDDLLASFGDDDGDADGGDDDEMDPDLAALLEDL